MGKGNDALSESEYKTRANVDTIANSQSGQRGISEEGLDQKNFTRYGISGGRQILTK